MKAFFMTFWTHSIVRNPIDLGAELLVGEGEVVEAALSLRDLGQEVLVHAIPCNINFPSLKNISGYNEVFLKPLEKNMLFLFLNSGNIPLNKPFFL